MNSTMVSIISPVSQVQLAGRETEHQLKLKENKKEGVVGKIQREICNGFPQQIKSYIVKQEKICCQLMEENSCKVF